ncbi:MAG: desulfoferrodoxin family protein [Candidatus Omnitrophota bacterium]
MKGMVCKVCGFISIDGAAPEKCPVCGALASAFVVKEDAIKTPANVNNLTDLEKKHIPLITVVKTCGLIAEGCQDVHVKMGAIQHPMLAEHYIVHIDFYINKKFISRVALTPESCNPAAALHLKIREGTLSVVSYCNLHGAWIQEAAL